MKNSDVRLTVYHKVFTRELYQREGTETKYIDVEMTIHNARKIIADENLLYAFNVFLKELRNHGYEFHVDGDCDE